MHWASALFRAWTIIVIFVAVLGAQVFQLGGIPGLGMAIVAVTGIATMVAALSWWSVRFRLDGDALVFETGLFRRHSRQIPLDRLQAVDLVRPIIPRLFGLAELRLEVAGGDRAELPFRYLGHRMAQRLRAELLARSAGLDAATPEAPERVIYRLPFWLLFSSLVLKLPVLISVIGFWLLIGIGLFGLEPGVLGGAVPLLIALLRGVVSPMLTYWGHTVAVSPDGLRLRYGLTQSRMQTVPPGRVHAVRLVEPLLWRQLHWARVEVNIAGYVGGRQVLSSVLLPAAPRRVALDVVTHAFPGVDVASMRLLPAARRGGPRAWFRGEAQAAGTDEVAFVTRRGVFCRELAVVAHARAQSVRLAAGPWQRLFGLATVHVDAAPGPVHVAAPDRGLREARAIVESEAERARRARARARPERWMTG